MDEEEEEEEEEGTKKIDARRAKIFDEFSEEEEEKRVVRSHKDKRFDDLKDAITKMSSAAKSGDWQKASDEFNNLNKVLEKTLKQTNLKEPPKMYIKAVADLEDQSNEAAKDKKKLSTLSAKALQSLKGKLRKNNQQYQAQIDAYKKDPKSFEKEDEAPKPEAGKEGQKQAPNAADSDKEEEDEKKEDDEEGWNVKSSKKTSKAQFWLAKGEEKEDKKEQKKPKKERKGKGQKEPKIKEPKTLKELKSEKENQIEWTDDLIDETISKITSNRGKRGVNTTEQYNQLKKLSTIARDPAKVIEILFFMISMQFDIVPPSYDFMPVESWRSMYNNLTLLMNLIDNHPELDIVEADAQTDEVVKGLRVSSTLVSILERFDDEYIKSLQYMEPYNQEYLARVRDEFMLLDIAERVLSWYKSRNDLRKAALVAVRVFDHLYYRKQSDHVKMLTKQRELVPQHRREAIEGLKNAEPSQKNSELINSDLTSFLAELSDLIYQHSLPETKIKVLVMNIFHHALHGRFYEARDLLLMSRLQDTIQTYEAPVQILYNRATAQLGLCAFSAGLISEAHACLAELYNSQRVRELLAQGTPGTRYQEKSKVVEQQERSRLVPYHMQINLDKLEAVHLISAMLLEIPHMAQNSYTNLKKKSISKALRRLLDYYDRQVFSAPPENTRDHINIAARALAKGDWQKCHQTLAKLPMWNAVVETPEGDEMLKTKIKTEALRTYLFVYGKHYDTIGLKELATMFDLKSNLVHSIVSKMMINEEFYASWDQPTQSIHVHRAEPNNLQFLTLQLAERVNFALEFNERAFDSKSGLGYGDKHDFDPSRHRINRGTGQRKNVRRTQQPQQRKQQRT
jgi:translation initiation factor 3 subunit C